MRTCTYEQFVSVFLQVIAALGDARDLCDFCHYDLHAGNVLIRDLPKSITQSTVYIPYRGFYIGTEKVSTVIDYGFSHLRVNGSNFGKYGRENQGVRADMAYPLHDIYKLLCWALLTLRTSNNSVYHKARVFMEIMIPTVQLNTVPPTYVLRESVDDIITKQRPLYYDLPVMNGLEKVTHMDYLNLVISRIPLGNVLVRNLPTGFPVLNCTATMCTNEAEISKVIPLRTRPKDIFELRNLLKHAPSTEIPVQYLDQLISQAVYAYGQNLEKIRERSYDSVTLKVNTVAEIIDPATLSFVQTYFEKFGILYNTVSRTLRIYDTLQDVLRLTKRKLRTTQLQRVDPVVISNVNAQLAFWKRVATYINTLYTNNAASLQAAIKTNPGLTWYFSDLQLVMNVSLLKV
jgi:hypothetical protein